MDLPAEQNLGAMSVVPHFYQIAGQSKEPTCTVATASFMQVLPMCSINSEVLYNHNLHPSVHIDRIK